jgi:hypothetical protein
MSASGLSQVRPNAFYRVSATSQLFNAEGGNAFTVGADVILQDMGKTVYLNNNVHRHDNILRKVKVMGVNDTLVNTTAYIYLAKAGGVSQNIAAL